MCQSPFALLAEALVAYDADLHRPPSFCSLEDNKICDRGEMSGLVALCDMLKTNTSLRELKCAPSVTPTAVSDNCQ